MINIKNNSDKLIIVLHEIYGINEHIKNICKLLSDKDFDVICPNLLKQAIPFDYSQEEIAYRNFMENIGFTKASNEMKRLLLNIKGKYKKTYIVGFSIGATIAWLCSEEEGIAGIIGYYGSRIRNYLEINPLCPTMLFFPEKEQSFNVDDLISNLEKKNILVHKFKGEHGFCDPYFTKYNAISTQETFNLMMDFFQEHQNSK